MTCPACSIVIRCHNEEAHIGRLLEGIRSQTLSNTETVVVDSGSTDGTLELLRKHPVRLVSIEPRHFSFGRALNLGFREARAEVVVAASAHVYPLGNDWLERLTAPLEDPAVGLCYGKQRGDHRTRLSEHCVFAQWFPEESVLDQPSPFCNNANVAVRRSLWQQHPYDEELTGLEDLAWAKAAQARGVQVAYSAEAAVAHVHEEGLTAVFNRYRREALALARIAPEEAPRPLELLGLWPRHIAADWMQARRQRCLATSFVDVVGFRTAQLLGTFQGQRDAPDGTPRLKERFYYPARRPRRSLGGETRAEAELRTATPRPVQAGKRAWGPLSLSAGGSETP